MEKKSNQTTTNYMHLACCVKILFIKSKIAHGSPLLLLPRSFSSANAKKVEGRDLQFGY
jgi:hypothetical protein